MKYVVLDQGAMRQEILQERIANDPGAIFIIPDIAFSEMGIKKDVRYTLRRSLTPLRSAIDRIYVAVSVKEIAEFEKRNGGNIIRLDQLLSGSATRVGRALIEGETSPDYAEVIKRIDDTEQNHKALFDPPGDRDEMRRQVLAFKKNFGAARVRLLRTPGAYGEDIRLGMIAMIMQAMTRAPGPFNGDVAKRMLLVRLLALMYWSEKDGLDNIKAEKIMNDFIDMEFVVIASYFDEIMTVDEKVRTLDRHVRRVMNIADAEAMIMAAEATGFRITR